MGAAAIDGVELKEEENLSTEEAEIEKIDDSNESTP